MVDFKRIPASLIKQKWGGIMKKDGKDEITFKSLYDNWIENGGVTLKKTAYEIVQEIYDFSQSNVKKNEDSMVSEGIFEWMKYFLKHKTGKKNYSAKVTFWYKGEIENKKDKNYKPPLKKVGDDYVACRMFSHEKYFYFDKKMKKEVESYESFEQEDKQQITTIFHTNYKNESFDKIYAYVVSQFYKRQIRMAYLFKQQYKEIVYIEVSDFQKVINKKSFEEVTDNIYQKTEEPKYFLNMMLRDDANEHYLSNDYMIYEFVDKFNLQKTSESFKEVMRNKNCDYVKENFKKNSCLFTAVINCFYDFIQKKKHTHLTYEKLAKIIQYDLKNSHNDCSITQMLPFFEKYGLKLKLYSINMRVIFEYIPESLTNDTKTMHLIIHNHHCYLLQGPLIKSLEQRTPKKFNTVEKINVDKYGFYPLPSDDKNVYEIYMIDNVEEMINKIGEAKDRDETKMQIKFISNNVFNLFVNTIRSGILPNVQFKNRVIESFSFSFCTEKQQIHFKVMPPIEEEDEKILHVPNSSQYVEMQNMMNVLGSAVLNKKYMSYYHPKTQEIEQYFSVKALNVSFVKEDKGEIYSGLDHSKAYATILYNLSKIPVFDIFDEYVPYDNHDIEDFTLYIVKSSHYICQETYSRQYGFIVKAIQKYCQILHYRKPKNIIDVDFKKDIDNVLNSKLEDRLKKDVINIVIGKLGKKQLTLSKSFIYKDFIEAEYNYSYFDAEELEVIKIGEEETDIIFCVNINKKQELINGFVHFNDLIVQLQNLRSYNTTKKLREIGVECVGIKNDCVLFNDCDDGFMIDEKESKRDVIKKHFKIGKNYGEFKFEDNKSTKFLRYGQEENIMMDIKKLSSVCSYTFSKDDEFDINGTKILETIDETNDNILVMANIAGAGKSSLCKKISKNSLFVCPTNALCQNIISEGIGAITINSLLGYDANGNKTQKYDVSGHDCIVFDEVLLHGEKERRNIQLYIKRNAGKRFVANGDISQLNPVCERGDEALDEYRQKSTNIMFPKQVLLQYCKRGYTQEDNEQLQKLRDDIFRIKDCKKILKLLIKEYKIPTITSIEQLKTKKNISFYRRTRDNVNNYWSNQMKRCGKTFYERCCVDDVILSQDYIKVGKVQIKSNLEFVVLRKEKTCVVIKNLYCDGEIMIPIDKFNGNFNFPFCNTIDSIQGMTIAQDITIFDMQSPYINYKYVYTMISRLRSLKHLTLMIYSEKEMKTKNNSFVYATITRQIEQHKKADKEKGFTYDENEYISFDWVSQQLQKQNYVSGLSGEILTFDTMSIDRIDSSKPHIKSNCHIVTLIENREKSNQDMKYNVVVDVLEKLY